MLFLRLNVNWENWIKRHLLLCFLVAQLLIMSNVIHFCCFTFFYASDIENIIIITIENEKIGEPGEGSSSLFLYAINTERNVYT